MSIFRQSIIPKVYPMFRQPIVPTAHNSESLPTVPTARNSDSYPIFRQSIVSTARSLNNTFFYQLVIYNAILLCVCLFFKLLQFYVNEIYNCVSYQYLVNLTANANHAVIPALLEVIVRFRELGENQAQRVDGCLLLGGGLY